MTMQPANPPSAAPLDLDALERLATQARDTMAYAACRVLDGEMDHEANAIASRAQGEFLHAVSSPAVILALLAAAQRGEEETPTPVKWLLHEGEHHTDTVYVEQRGQRDGSTRYVVTQSGFVLNSDGEWEYEPLPSSRTDEFIARTRHAALANAVAAFRAARSATPTGDDR